MQYVNTVLGPIHPAEMGVAATHEHLLWGLRGWECDPSSWFSIGTAFEECYKQLMDYKLRGGGTFVDCSTVSTGRDMDIIVKLAAATRVHIVASTGLESDTWIAPHFRAKEADACEEFMFRELTQGIGRTTIKAGLIRLAHGGATLSEAEVLRARAAARAARRTGAAVMADGGALARRYFEILTEEKLDPSRIILAHCDRRDSLDVERDKEMARRGAYVAYSNVGLEEWSTRRHAMQDDRRVGLVLAMVEAKHHDRILLSTGARCQVLGRSEPSLHNVTHLVRYFARQLIEAGLDEPVVDSILTANPQRVLPIQ